MNGKERKRTSVRRLHPRYGAILAMLALIVSVSFTCVSDRRPECDEYNTFFDLGPTDEQNAEFLKQTIESQLEIYVCGWYREPRPLHFADVFAERGDEAIPLVLDRIKREKRELSQKALVYIFVRMSSKGYLRGRKDVADAIRPIVSAMKDPYTKESTQKYLDEIEKEF